MDETRILNQQKTHLRDAQVWRWWRFMLSRTEDEHTVKLAAGIIITYQASITLTLHICHGDVSFLPPK